MKTRDPIIHLHLFKKLSFSAPIFAIFVFGGTTSLGFIIPPYFLEEVKQFSSWQVGLVNLACPLGLVIVSKIAGKLISSLGSIILMVIGLFLMIISYAILGALQENWGAIIITLLLLIYGIGGGFFLPSNTSSIMGAVSEHMQGTVGATQRMVQNIGIAVYTAITSLFINKSSSTEKLIIAARESWIFAAITLVLALLPLLFKLIQRKKETPL